ncbi:bifunctional protein-serine/threonine kinase/phosphatase [Aliagarivorans marinus]|uniref:bifunctional protein-serine/threonine kinase/phosphatase n=1 Tax=Aliagarivorans marinus TaxID=561965 RepID=UPI0003FF5FC7|nr:bifunctional protein-serine/threonine kinase/phosphatase [Aliagarivorans marinus]
MKKLQVEIRGFSSEGTKPLNQDAFAAKVPEGFSLDLKGAAIAIADGVSISANSHIASQTSVTNFINDYYATPDSWSVNQSAARVITALNSWMFNKNSKSHEDSLVCTLSTLIFKSTSAHLFHVGDSRIYRLSEQGFKPLTRDHVQFHGNQDILSRAVGIDSHLEVDYSRVDLKEGDVFLLSTDGVHHFLSDQAISECFLTHQDNLSKAAEQICQQALAQGCDDNLTCVLARVLSLPEEDINEAHRRITKLAIPPVLKPGNVLEGYTICRVLFSGTRSHVYLVEDDKGKQFALKTPSENFADDPLYLEGFLREEWVGSTLNHRCIMRIFPRPEESRFMYHLCEYLDGQNLRQWIIDHPKASLDEVRAIIYEVCRGLRAFQRSGMVHRDLKPENVIIDRFGQVKIIDFGTVWAEGLDEIKSVINDNVPVGSVDYIAPEYLMGARGDFKSDMFSLGILCYEMLGGKTPFNTSNFRNAMPKSYNAWKYQALSEKRPDLPKWFDLTLEKACSPNPNERQQAFSEFTQDLKNPNPSLTARYQNAPLMQRHPTKFWQIAAALSLLGNLLLLVAYLNTN